MTRPENLFRASAIVLRRYEYGEADRLLTLLTREHGKIRVIAKGVRKPQARMAGHVELFSRGNLLIRRGHDLHTLTQAEQTQPYQSGRESLPWFGYAAYLADLLDRFTEFDEPNASLYNLLEVALDWLAVPDADMALIARFFELRLLRLVGYEPSLFRCAVGQEPVEAQDQFFSALDGGIVCPEHVRGRTVIPIRLNALKLLRYLQTHDYAAIRTLEISQGMHQTLERILQAYVAHLLETRLKTVDFLLTLRHSER